MTTDTPKKPGLILNIFIWTAALACSVYSVMAEDRYSVASGNWNTTVVWSATPGGPPGASIPGKQDDVFIENGHAIIVTISNECLSVTFTGENASLEIIAPATLSVKNSVTLNKLTNQNSACLLTGTGSLLCVEVAVGSETNPPPTDPSYSVFTHTFTSRIAQLLISVKGSPKNDITINSYIGTASHIRNGIFNLESGSVTVDGKIVTNNLDAVNTSVFSMAAGAQSATLNLNGRGFPFTFSGIGTDLINFNGSFSLVNYCLEGNQTLLGTEYNHLTLSGSGIKTMAGVTMNGILSMEELAVSSGITPVYNAYSTLQYKGSAPQITGIEFPGTFTGAGGVIIDNADGVTLNDGRTISTMLSFLNGRINTGIYELVMTSAAVVNGAGDGRYVNGNLRKGVATGSTVKLFEIGDAIIYTPVNLSFTGTITTEGMITARTTPGDHPDIASSTFNSGVTVNRFWALTNSGVSGFIAYSATFTFAPGDIDVGADFNNFYIGNYNAPTWIYPPLGVLTDHSTQATGLSTFGDFQIGELPVASFRSRQSGSWDLASTWESFDGAVWVAATSTPASAAGYITIRASHIVTVPVPVMVDQVIVDPGGYLALNANIVVNDGSSIDFTVNGTLDCAQGDLSGPGSFILNSFADLIIRSPDGITSTGGTGNIQTSSRTFSDWADYSFSGSIAQVTGTGLPSTVNNLTFDNPGDVSLTASVSVRGTLNLVDGEFTVGAATLTFLSSDTPILRVSGTLTTTALTDIAFGTIDDPMGSAFTIPPGIFTTPPVINNLTIHRTSGITLNDQLLSINGILLNNGLLNTNGNLLLASGPAGTALIDGAGTGQITGNVTMERYLQSGFGYKYLSSPFTAATVAGFGDDMDLNSLFPAFYRYNESSSTSGWIDYSDPAGQLYPLHGYAVNFGTSSSPSTADITGGVNNGELSVTLYNNNNPYTLGFNLVGNPYPSPIDWDSPSGWTKFNIDNALYYFKASTTDEYGGTYSTYINGISSDGLATSVIPSMQGFFIHVSDGIFPVTATLGLNNGVRITDLTHSLIKSPEKGNVTFLRLSASFDDDVLLSDPLVIYFNEKASDGFDRDLEAMKLLNTDYAVPNFYSVSSDDKKLSINALPYIPDVTDRIPLGLKLSREGLVTFKITGMADGLKGKPLYLTDMISEKEYDLSGDSGCRIYLKQGEYINRFFLNLSSLPVGTPDPDPPDEIISIYQANGRIMIDIGSGKFQANNVLSISSLTGQVLFMKKNLNTGYHEFDPGIKDGVCIVTFSSREFRISRKILIQSK